MAFVEIENLFMDKYFREALKDSKVEDFLQSTQRNLTMAQYEAKFTKLSWLICKWGSKHWSGDM